MAIGQHVYTFEEYQSIASKLFEKYEIPLDMPIEPDLLASQMDIYIGAAKDLKRNYGIKGVCCLVDGKFEIFIDERHWEDEPQSSIMTIGEELGHIILHLDGYENIKYDDWILEAGKITHDRNRYLHQEARYLASNIIFPAAKFTDYVLDLVERNIKDYSRRFNFNNHILAGNIAADMEDELEVSMDICQIALQRWPDYPIGAVVRKFPAIKNRKNRS